MEREHERRPRDKRNMTADGMETRSENLGDAGREDFSRRALPSREPGGAPLSVRDTIARYREQAKQADGQASAPAEDAPLNMEETISPEQPPTGTNSRFIRPAADRGNADAARSAQRSTAYSRRFVESEVSAPGASAPETPQASAPNHPGASGPLTEPLPAEQSAERNAQPPAREIHGKPEHTPRPFDTRPGRLRFGGADKTASAAPTRPAKPKDAAGYVKPGDVASAAAAPAGKTDKAVQTETPPADKTPAKSKKPSKLQFGKDEAPTTAAPSSKKQTKTRGKAERSAVKLDKAKKKLPQKRRLSVAKSFDAEIGKPKRTLHFETEVKTRREHLKGPLLTRPVKAGANAAVAYGHKKIYQVEHENVGTQAAHRGEMLAEGGLRVAYRFHKTAPYRKVERLGKKTAKLNIKADYHRAPRDNPKLKSNLLSRMAQKRKIKKQYAKAAREAKKTAQKVKKTGDIVGSAAQAVARTVARHPVLFGVIAGLGLLFVLISALFGSCSNIAAGGGSAIAASSYLAEDADVDAAELSYTEWETDLQLEIASAESTHPGFDEYRYSTGDISHNPYELMAYLTARFRDFTYSGVEADLRAVFAEQYRLTFTESVETRYRTVTKTDPDTGEEYEEQEACEWRVLTVTLTARSFTDVVSGRLSAEQSRHYSLLLRTKGNRQYADSPFDFNWLSYVSCYYGWRVHPVTGAKDYHKAADIAVPQGTEIHAANAGTAGVGYDAGGYGNYVTITGADGLVTKYAHCSEVLVTSGRTVNAGDVIARVGSTGQSTGSHLHFEVTKNGLYLNPLYFAITNDDGSAFIPPGSPGGRPIPDYPGEPMDDPSFAALMEEAQKHLGKPYVFGANGPDAFDCGSFVSRCLTKSSVKNTGRLGAQALYNLCTPVSRENLRPGDLVFLTGTYSCPNPVSHVAIYVGNGMVIHAGSPIRYTSIDTAFRQSHHYAYGRVNP